MEGPGTPISIESLQATWTNLYKERLPELAKTRASVQSIWPVSLDHCFARIILDNAVSKEKPWMEVVKAPATKNMSVDQLKAAINLGEAIANGTADLVELDQRSLQLRGKTKTTRTAKRKRAEDGEDSKINSASAPLSSSTPKKRKQTSQLDIRSHFFPTTASKTPPSPPITPSQSNPSDSSLISARALIASSADLTPFRKLVLTLLTLVPRGRYTTYGAMSDYISSKYHKTCARAIGNAMRNNPFAPTVPCHRVLAGDGRIGEFGGHWGEDGKHADEKKRLLAEEGVRFDGRGRVVGEVFRQFEEVEMEVDVSGFRKDDRLRKPICAGAGSST